MERKEAFSEKAGALGVTMSILLIDESYQADSLKADIERATSWPTILVSTMAQGLKTLLTARQRISVAVIPVNGNRGHTLRFIQTANRLGSAGVITRPYIIVLSATSQPPDFAARLDRLGIQLLLRKYPDQIVEAVRKLQWQVRTTNGLATIIIERRGGQVTGARVNYRGATERLQIGPRLLALLTYLVIHRKAEHSTHALADALGISSQSIKEYFLRLRRTFDQIRARPGISLSGETIFWTKRVPGGFVHGLNTNTEIEDSEEFFFPDEGCSDTAEEFDCRVCHRSNPRSRTAWSHVGSICESCVLELQSVGEV